jgi:HSP20 family protein
MNLIRWQPRTVTRMGPPRELGTLTGELERIFDCSFGDSDRGPCSRPAVPPLDVIEEENRYVVRADLPGLTKDDIEITYQDGTLTIRGERKERDESNPGRVHLTERFCGSFGRNLRLPEKVDPERIEASFKDGVLGLVLPFTPEAQPKKIQITQ